MGIKDFTKVFKPTKRVEFKDVAGENFAVDAYLELFRTSSMQHVSRLTNPAGEPTMHLNIALANAAKRKALGANDIWCWDSRDPRHADDLKQATLADRAAIRKSNMEEIKKLEEEVDKLKYTEEKLGREELLKSYPTFDTVLSSKVDQIEMLRARNPDAQHFSSMIRDVQFILTKLGVRMAFAPVGIDSEHLAAQLCRENLCAGVITTDTDAIVYGATKILKKVPKETGKYDLIELADCLEKHDLTYSQLVEVASVLGCDFCDKTPGVGAATVIKKIKDKKIQFTDKQKAAQDKFLDHTSVKYDYVEPKCTNETLDELCTWLIKVQGFNSERVKKVLKPFYTK